MKRVALLLLLASCGVQENRSKILEFKDIKRAEIRSDGLYNVVCMDGSFEIGVTQEQITSDKVCNKSTGPKPSPSPGSPVATSGFDVFDAKGMRLGRFLGESPGHDLRVLLVDGRIANISAIDGTFKKSNGSGYWGCMFQSLDCKGECFAPTDSYGNDYPYWSESADGPWVIDESREYIDNKTLKSTFENGTCINKGFTSANAIYKYERWQNPYGRYPLSGPIAIR
jgi:hypothetical protein